jgi:hypothetical protein
MNLKMVTPKGIFISEVEQQGLGQRVKWDRFCTRDESLTTRAMSETAKTGSVRNVSLGAQNRHWAE